MAKVEYVLFVAKTYATCYLIRKLKDELSDLLLFLTNLIASNQTLYICVFVINQFLPY